MIDDFTTNRRFVALWFQASWICVTLIACESASTKSGSHLPTPGDCCDSGGGDLDSAEGDTGTGNPNPADGGSAVDHSEPNSLQPYETILANNPADYFVAQASALCGVTSFYMIVKFYGDHLADTQTGLVDPPSIQETIDYPSKLDTDSKTYRYIVSFNQGNDPQVTGILWSALIEAVSNLKNESGSSYYPIVESQDTRLTSTSDATDRQKRTIFLDEIVPFLQQGAPVLVHLWRSVGSGHYVVVVGYDASAGQVYIIDPNMDNHSGNECTCAVTPVDTGGTWTCFMQKVSLGDFINEYWYKADGSYPLNARWDGTWLGFRKD